MSKCTNCDNQVYRCHSAYVCSYCKCLECKYRSENDNCYISNLKEKDNFKDRKKANRFGVNKGDCVSIATKDLVSYSLVIYVDDDNIHLMDINNPNKIHYLTYKDIITIRRERKR